MTLLRVQGNLSAVRARLPLSRVTINPPLSLCCIDPRSVPVQQAPEREFVIDNLLVRIHFIIVMIRWTGHAESWVLGFGVSLRYMCLALFYHDQLLLSGPGSQATVLTLPHALQGRVYRVGVGVRERERGESCTRPYTRLCWGM